MGKSYKYFSYLLAAALLLLAGCSREQDSPALQRTEETDSRTEVLVTEGTLETENFQVEAADREAEGDSDNIQERIIEADWKDFFEGMNGSGVIYDPAGKCYQIYEPELALTKRPPCSTFKIISSLTALENGVIEPGDSVRTWSGETFWNDAWNRDIDFYDAFRASCVWYFREVIDEIGKDRMQEELNRLQYGNCDISDWEGRLNTNNSNPALTGFWIESSLLISPKEQTEVMERIFGIDTDYSEETLNQLKQVMLLSGPDETGIAIYGKTGMGKSGGVVVDAWYTGFADAGDKRIYFCVHLDRTDQEDVSSARAREIAVRLVRDYLENDREVHIAN